MNTNETVSLSIITENERIQDNPKTREEEEDDDDDDEGVDNNVGPSVGHEMDFQDGVYQMQDDSSIGDTSASCPINPDSLEEKQKLLFNFVTPSACLRKKGNRCNIKTQHGLDPCPVCNGKVLRVPV